MVNKSFVLMILDGWGYSTNSQHNAIEQANTPQWDRWWSDYAHCLLDASGACVGLPEHQMGNSEVGHMHIGAGRIIPQEISRINQAIEKDHLAVNLALVEAIERAKKNNKAIHILGLLSDGGVHSHQNHLFALLKLLDEYQFNRIYLHVFLDGRDTPPKSAETYLRQLTDHLRQHPVAELKSLSGRYYAMDRDKRWDRVQPVYDMLTQGISAHSAPNAIEAIEQAYRENLSDEFIPPTLLGKAQTIKDGDIVLCFNFRADRVRQLCHALSDVEFDGFERASIPDIHLVTMTRYAKNLPAAVLFPPATLKNTLGEVIANQGLTQLRLAETEKYAHITFFLNGGNEVIYPGEDRVLIPSAHVATYDMKPQMSAAEITHVLLESLANKDHQLIICNYANADMVGHTGNMSATIEAIEFLDSCFKRLSPLIERGDVELLITADHGNAEAMFNEKNQQAHTAHTCEPVPLLYVGRPATPIRKMGSLIDVAPTLLHLMGLSIPEEMQGQTLFNLDAHE